MVCHNCFCVLISSLGMFGVVALGMTLNNENGGSVVSDREVDYISPPFYSIDEIERNRPAVDETRERLVMNKIDNWEEVPVPGRDKWTRNSDLPTIYYPRIG